MVTGRMTKLMDLVSTNMQMDQNMKGSGLKINSTVKVRKFGQMELNLSVTISSERKKDKETFSGQMDRYTKVNSKVTAFMALDTIDGPTAEHITGRGKKM